MWLNQQIFYSRPHFLSMEGSRRVSSIEDLPSQILDTGVDQLPGQLLDNLGLQLFNEGRGVAGNWEGVAEELGINTTRELEQIRRHAQVEHMFPGRLMLRDWGRKSGSTVFVLLNALRRQGREDCIDLVIKACKDVHSMQLHVKIEEYNGQHRYLSVTTKKDATLAASLENVLSGLPSYIITGPDHKLTWQTPACHLKGTQLSLKKGEVTEESERNVYGIVQITQQKSQVQHPREDNCLQNNYNPYTTQSIPVPLNIPVTEPPSTSNNFISATEPKVQEPFVSLPISYNDLSKQGQGKPFLPPQDFPSLTSSPQFFTNSFLSRGPSQAERQTLLKKPSYSVDESAAHFGNLTSVTAPKHCLSNFSQFRAGSLDDQETLMKRCDPLRHSEGPIRHVLKQSDYVPHTHPMINFSNQILNPDKQGVMSSPIQCRRPLPRAKNEDYVSPDSLHSITGSPASLCKPKPCIKNSIHVSSDNMPPPDSTPPKPMVKPKPVPCVLQQRKDGYIDILAQGKGGGAVQGSQVDVSTHVLRQQSVPEASPMSVDLSEGQAKERPKSLSEEIAKATPPACVLSTDGCGYATFASPSSLMEVDPQEGSGESVMFTCPVHIDTDVDGYLSFSGDSAAASMESSMEGESSGGPQTQGGPLVIQQSSDGYFGFGSATTSSSSPQLIPGSAPQACAPSDYVDMSRSESLPNMPQPARNPDGLIYARFSEEDEEEDADYFDMKHLPNVSLMNKQPTNANRHWSEGDIESLSVVTTSSQYDYINESEQTPPRSLPPRPTHPVPMKRRRFRSQDPENQTQADLKRTVDLDTVPGWCPNETEDTISSTMKRYQQEDGNFMVWWMGRKKRYVVTVSHMNDLRHYAVYERSQGAKMRLFIFAGGDEFESLKSLVEHYMREGLKGPELPTGHSRGKRWQQFSHVRLRKPLKVKYTHTVVRKKAT